MITLATLKDATAQEVFDQVATHMLKQMKRSGPADTGGCWYRHGDLKCAAGCLISDDEYVHDMDEGDSSWSDLVAKGFAPEKHSDIISYLQSIHDEAHPDHWHQELKKFAETYNLEMVK